jgi:hypothetical protein
MRWDPDVIKEAGGDPEKLREIFELPDAELLDKHPKVHDLITLHSNRIQEGIDWSLQNARVYRAIDDAFDVSQNQISYTLVKRILSDNPGPEDLLNLARELKLDNLIIDDKSGKAAQITTTRGNQFVIDDKKGKVHLPTFFTIYVPMVMAYVKIRWAKLYNDRDLTPFYKYDPAIQTTEEDMVCRVITKVIEKQATEMGYRRDEKDSILHMLMYGQCINFPKESYYREEQVLKRWKDGEQRKTKTVVREGVRFEIPHITKTFWDRSEPLGSLNTDTGVRFHGYWDIWPFRDIANNDAYWNVENISIGRGGWQRGDKYRIYNTLYPCRMRFPTGIGTTGSPVDLDNDRKTDAYRYNRSEPDMGVNVVVFFDKINPKQWGLYDYDHEVWHRFVYAGDRTVLYCEPILYTPGVVYLYDHDRNRAVNSSLALELLPFQDHISNLLSQYLLSVKKNLIRITGVNKDMIDSNQMAKIANDAENQLRGIGFYEYSERLMSGSGNSVANLFTPLQIGQPQNTQEIMQAMNMIITILERLLGFSPQEVGGSASHQQSATEVNIANANTTVRMQFTGTAIDEAIHAKKMLLLEALQCYGSDQGVDQILASLTDIDDQSRAALENRGFQVQPEGNQTYGIYGDISRLSVNGLASYRDGLKRMNDPQQGQVLLAFVDRLLSQPALMETAGIEWVVRMINESAVKLGIPLDLRIPPPGQSQPQMNEEILQQVAQAIEQSKQQVIEEVAGPMAELTQQTQQNTQDLAMLREVLTGAAQQGVMI